jgi:hypothetical protein
LAGSQATRTLVVASNMSAVAIARDELIRHGLASTETLLARVGRAWVLGGTDNSLSVLQSNEKRF